MKKVRNVLLIAAAVAGYVWCYTETYKRGLASDQHRFPSLYNGQYDSLYSGKIPDPVVMCEDMKDFFRLWSLGGPISLAVVFSPAYGKTAICPDPEIVGPNQGR